MIEVIGIERSAEFEAAMKIKQALTVYWPGVAESPPDQDHVKIASNTKLAGYKVSDVDIVVAGRFGRSRYIVPKKVLLDKDGNRLVGTRIRVRSLVAAIEVKGHDASGLEISNGGINVKYKEGYKSATDQNDAQLQALRNYFRDVTRKDPWIYRSVFLTGINELPKERGRQTPDAGAFAANFDLASMLCAMSGIYGIGKIGNEYTISSAVPETMDAVLAAPIFQKILPSTLDRQKMDRIAARPRAAKGFATKLGTERVHFRGEGGTGKTVLLAQTAHEAFKSYGKRSLFLTYNHALAADIQRLLALLGVPSSGDYGGVDVRTVMSFMYSWLRKLGVINEDEEFDFDRYSEHCEMALKFFNDGLLSDADIEKAMEANFEEFNLDAILVDEAQDWPQPEADLLVRLYGGERLSLADGISQLIRGKATDWRSSVKNRKGTQNIAFNECLRMKSNLGIFANAVAERAGLNWQVLPNTSAAGGRIIVRTGSFHEMSDLHQSLLSKASSEGNEPIDFLYCVPSSGVSMQGNTRSSILGKNLANRGLAVWDGVDPIARKDYPRSTRDNRIVQYDSCRGLEGWVVVLDGLDSFWNDKFEGTYASSDSSNCAMSSKERARRVAWTWCMMALTRPIDTLVITINSDQSEVGKVLKRVAECNPDIVEF